MTLVSKELKNQKMKPTEIQIECDCGEIITIDLASEKLDWEVVEADEREMGTERLHEAILYYDCPECNDSLMITLHVWEYPEGFDNMQDIDVKGGQMVIECDLGQFLFDEDDDKE